MKTRTRNIWIAVAILAIIIFNPVTILATWLVPAYWSNKHPEIGEHVDHVNWLPPTASDICYFKTYSNTAYEFNIPENDFMNWAAKIKLSEIHDPFQIERYTRSLADRSEMQDGRGNPSWKDYGLPWSGDRRRELISDSNSKLLFDLPPTKINIVQDVEQFTPADSHQPNKLKP